MSHSLHPLHFAMEIRNKTLDLAIVEDNAIGFITDQTPGSVGPIGCHEIGGDVNQVRFQAEGLIRFEVDLIPAKSFIRRDLKGLADRFRLSQKSYQTFGEIRVPGK